MNDIMAGGGPVMWPLLLCSLLAVAVGCERVTLWLRESSSKKNQAAFALWQLIKHNELQAALASDFSRQNYMGRVLLAGLKSEPNTYKDNMEAAAQREIERLNRGLSILDTIVTLAPLLGILGTVLGIIESFTAMGGLAQETPRMVTAGIAQALITTAAGLIISLTALVFFNYLVSRVRKATHQMEQLILQFSQLPSAVARG